MRHALMARPRQVGSEHRGAMARTGVAWAAVVLTLSVAVLSAFQPGSGGLAVFAVGMASAVNPREFALLPTYLALYLGTSAAGRRSWRAQLRRALLVSLKQHPLHPYRPLQRRRPLATGPD